MSFNISSYLDKTSISHSNQKIKISWVKTMKVSHYNNVYTVTWILYGVYYVWLQWGMSNNGTQRHNIMKGNRIFLNNTR